MDATRLQALLLEKSKEYSRLHRQHQDLELRLKKKQDRQLAAGEQAIETRRIKKRKLVLKDRMAAIAQEFAKQNLHHS